MFQTAREADFVLDSLGQPSLKAAIPMKRVPFSSRRQFLATSAAALGFPTIIPSRVLGQDAPSNKITMAVIGWGMMGPSNTSKFLA